jgi:hypothetical protein
MAVEERGGSLTQPAALGLCQLVEQWPMLLDSHRARCLWPKSDFRFLHTIHIPFLTGNVNVGDCDFQERSRGWNLAWASFKSVMVKRRYRSVVANERWPSRS